MQRVLSYSWVSWLIFPFSSSPSWVGYEKEGFRGHQYLLEEGEYADWSQWGGYDEFLTSLRVIRTVSRSFWLSFCLATPQLLQHNLREEFAPLCLFFLAWCPSPTLELVSLPLAALP